MPDTSLNSVEVCEFGYLHTNGIASSKVIKVKCSLANAHDPDRFRFVLKYNDGSYVQCDVGCSPGQELSAGNYPVAVPSIWEATFFKSYDLALRYLKRFNKDGLLKPKPIRLRFNLPPYSEPHINVVN